MLLGLILDRRVSVSIRGFYTQVLSVQGSGASQDIGHPQTSLLPAFSITMCALGKLMSSSMIVTIS